MRFIQAMTMSSLIIASLLEVSHAFVCDKDIDMIVSGTSTPSLLMQELGQLYAAQRLYK